MTEVKVDGRTAEEHRAEAAKQYARVDESWQRSDTDGFLSQWAASLTGDLHRRNADIAEAGGKASFVVLLDADGEIVPSRQVDTKYGSRRVTLDANGRFVQFMGWSEKAAAKHGFTEATVWHPAKAITTGRGTGLSGTAWNTTKPICGTCGSFVEAIGQPCKEGHLTATEFVREGVEGE